MLQIFSKVVGLLQLLLINCLRLYTIYGQTFSKWSAFLLILQKKSRNWQAFLQTNFRESGRFLQILENFFFENQRLCKPYKQIFLIWATFYNFCPQIFIKVAVQILRSFTKVVGPLQILRPNFQKVAGFLQILQIFMKVLGLLQILETNFLKWSAFYKFQ